jgi:O-antigen/teichoic acid export membrane protein
MKLNRIYTWLRHPDELLSQRVVHAGFWAFALRIVSRLFGLARTIVLARLLAPNDFGLYGIALLSLSALETFSQTGFDQALIQKKEDTKPYLDTAWTAQVIRGFVLALILVIGAPLVGSFFGEPRAVLLVRVLGAAVFLKSFVNIGIVYFRKELEFHKQFIYEFSGTFADLVVAIPAAFILRSVWALVFGLLAGNLVRMVVSYFVHPYRPRPRLEGPKVRELFTFGRWILAISILGFLVTQGDDIFVGKVLGLPALGFYQLAYRISSLPATEVSHVVSAVTFPAYSKLQDTILRLRMAYLQILQITAFISIPLAGGIFVLATDFTRIFLGSKWMPIVPAMRMLAIWGLIRSIMAIMSSLFKAIGRPNVFAGLQFSKLILIAILIYPLSLRWGILGTSLTIVLSSLLAESIPGVYLAVKTIQCPIWSFMRLIIFPICATVIMMGVMWILRFFLFPEIHLRAFLTLASVGVATYGVAAYMLDRLLGYGITEFFKKQIGELRRHA